jgi:hypothetical protein
MSIHNYYFKNIDSHLVAQDYWDFILSSDDQGKCLDYILDCSDSGDSDEIIKDKLVLWFDINNSGCTVDGTSLASLTEWDSGETLDTMNFSTFGGSNNLYIKPSSGFTLCDFGLTGVDNGRYDKLSGITVTITSADTKMNLFPVTGYTIQEVTITGCTSATTTVEYITGTTSGGTGTTIISAITSTTCVTITSSTYYETTKGIYDYPMRYMSGTTVDGCNPGATICTDGGFYQGYFKLDFLDPAPTYEEEETSCGIETTAMAGDPDEKFYQIMPTTFEDGWTMETWIKWGGECCYSASTSGLTGSTGVTATTVCLSGHTINDDFPNNEGFFFYIGTRAENKFRNVFSGESGYTTCTGIPLQPISTTEYLDNGIANWFLKDTTVGFSSCNFCCNTGTTTDPSGTTIVTSTCDELSENALGFRVTPDGRLGYRKMTVTGACFNDTFRITGTTMEESYSEPILSTTGSGWSHIAVTYTGGSVKNTLPAGTIRFWLNGRVIHRIDEFVGLQLRALDEKSDKQLGVPFNISWGGGTQGLLESQTFGGPDPEDRNLLLETNFAGTFNGELSQLRFYEKPLNVLEVRHNFFIDGCLNNGKYCKRENFGGSQIIQPSSEFCSEC